MMTTYVRLYSDALGESHFADVEIDLASTDYTPPSPPLFLSDITATTQFRFMRAPAGWTSDWHTSSSRTMFFVLAGEWEVTASDGESRRFSAGSALLVEDTSGKGHASRVTSETGSLAAMIELQESSQRPRMNTDRHR
jgi:hypothetical protein